MQDAGMRTRWRRRVIEPPEPPEAPEAPEPPEAPESPEVSDAPAASEARAASTAATDTGDHLTQQLGLHPLIGRLLVSRGIQSTDQARGFLHPQLTDLHDPAALPGCARAAERLADAVRAGQRIVVYGDYDVDGVTAAATLWHILHLAGADVHTYIPHRIDEGYGLNVDAIAGIARGELPAPDDEGDAGQSISDAPPANGNDMPPLIVSVDCGIAAPEAATAARELGVDLIITDHHQFDANNLPDAFALVHPRLPTPPSAIHHPPSPYPCPHLCGAGVAFKLAWQFAKTYNGGSERVPQTFRDLLMDLLSLVALGTVADVVPLVGENRILTIYGLGRAKQTRFDGLNALIDAASLRDEKIDAYHVGFVLGPRLNACGRMGHARQAVHLLTTATGETAKELAEFLTKENDRRRVTEREIFTEAEQMVRDCEYDADASRAIVIGKENWHPGVIGIVASRLVDRFARPVVMLNYDNGTAQGSARSVQGVSIYEAFDACRAHLQHFGGHAMAAGLKLARDHVDAFRRALVDYTNAHLSTDDLVGVLEVDDQIALADCTLDLFRQIQRLAPFGRGNPEPRLLLRDVTLDAPPQCVGREGRHLLLSLRQGDRCMRAIGFGMGEFADQLAPGQTLDVAFEPKVSTWRGEARPDLHMRDIKPH